MLRRAFLRRMAFAALATWFVDLPLPRESYTMGKPQTETGDTDEYAGEFDGTWQIHYREMDSGEWTRIVPAQPYWPIELALPGLNSGTWYEFEVVPAP